MLLDNKPQPKRREQMDSTTHTNKNQKKEIIMMKEVFVSTEYEYAPSGI
jgi:hypothetical protein